MAMHEGQLDVTAAVLAGLVADQFPEYARLPIAAVSAPGTVNAIFRIGDVFTARLQLLPEDVDVVRRRLQVEADRARLLAARTRYPVPEPVAIGEPGLGYPMPWAIQTWLPGATAGAGDADSLGLARDLAEFIRDVREIDLDGRKFGGPGRGGDLRSHDEWIDLCLDRSADLVDIGSLRKLWERLRLLPRNSPDVMTHGDLIPTNLLVSDGRLIGVLDIGGLGAADPALDLVIAWHLFDAGRRRILRDDLDCDDVEWERGKAWAFEQAAGLVWYYIESNPPMSLLGRTTLERILADEAGPEFSRAL